MKRFVLAGVCVAVAAGSSAAAQVSARLAAGRRVYDDKKCVVCHMIDGQGNRMFPLDGVGSRLTAADLRKWLTSPAEMEAKLDRQPAIRMSSKNYNLKDADLDALVAYLQTLK
jgi:mono/diheme cytochrome c family protein